YIGPATAPHASSARVDNVCFSIVSPSGHRGSPSCWTGGGGLEELDDVAGGVLEQYLLAAGSFEDVVAEPSTGAAETGHLGIDVVDDEVDAVPAARPRLGAIRHRPRRGASRSAEQQPQVPAGDVGESGSDARQNLEIEDLRVERDGGFHVVD